MDARRRELFDDGRYKHIGYSIVDDPDVEINTDTVEGVMALIDCCMLTPHMQYDLERGAFLLVDIFQGDKDEIIVEATSYERYETGFAENEEYYSVLPSDKILSDIDEIIDKEWRDLLRRIKAHPA